MDRSVMLGWLWIGSAILFPVGCALKWGWAIGLISSAVSFGLTFLLVWLSTTDYVDGTQD